METEVPQHLFGIYSSEHNYRRLLHYLEQAATTMFFPAANQLQLHYLKYKTKLKVYRVCNMFFFRVADMAEKEKEMLKLLQEIQNEMPQNDLVQCNKWLSRMNKMSYENFKTLHRSKMELLDIDTTTTSTTEEQQEKPEEEGPREQQEEGPEKQKDNSECHRSMSISTNSSSTCLTNV